MGLVRAWNGFDMGWVWPIRYGSILCRLQKKGNFYVNYELDLTSNLTCCLFERIIIINVTHHIYFIWKYLLLIFTPLMTPPSKLGHIKIQTTFTIESYRKLMVIHVATYIWPHSDSTIRLSPRIDKYRLDDEIIKIDSSENRIDFQNSTFLSVSM